MKQTLLIIRGNSGSGKSTLAKAVRSDPSFGQTRPMLVQQDVVRRDILNVRDTADNESIGLIDEIVRYGLQLGKHVILEGILDRWKYGEMLYHLIDDWNAVGAVHVYYYDLPLDVTLARHDLRPQRDEFSKEAMRDWYNTDNLLNVPGERIFDEHVSVEAAVAKLLADMGIQTKVDL